MKITNDVGFPSDRFGICVVCNRPFPEGAMIATAPEKFWKTSRNGVTVRFGHLKCVKDARSSDSPLMRQRRDEGPKPERIACEACGYLAATVDLVIRSTGKVHISICGQCAIMAVQDDQPNLDRHQRAFGPTEWM
jgi:hypothetical protein